MASRSISRLMALAVVLGLVLGLAPWCLAQDLSKLKINEVQSTWGVSDYVEVYNSGDTAIELVPLVLKDRTYGVANERVFCLGHVDPHGLWSVDVPYLLNTRGEEVALFDTEGNLLDTITFPPFPPASWDLSFGRVPDGGDAWCFQQSSRGAPNAPENARPTVVVDMRYSPIWPRVGETFTVTARLLTAQPPKDVRALHGAPGAPKESATAYDDGLHGDGEAGDGVFGAVIGPFPSERLLEYALSVDGATPDQFNFAPCFLQYGHTPPAIRINEVLALNRKAGTWAPGSAGSCPDYVELYNAGDTRVNVSQLMFRQTFASDPEFTFQITTSSGDQPLWMDPGQHLLIWASPAVFGMVPVGTGLSLSHNGEDLLLVTADGHAIVDAVTYPPLGIDEAYGRVPEGTGPFRVLDAPTPQGGDLYPPGMVAFIGASVAAPKPDEEIPLLVWISSELDSPTAQVRFRMEGAQGTTPLFNDGLHDDDQAGDEIFGGSVPPLGQTGNLEFAIEVTEAGGTVHRDPYRPDEWHSLPVGLQPLGKLVINEILATRFDEGGICPAVWDPSQGQQPTMTKFVELYNSGMSLEDAHFVITGSMFNWESGLQFKRGHIGDLGTVKVFDWDGLDPRGGILFLRGVETGTLYDAVTYPALLPGKSYGRSPDGGPWKVLDEPSPGKLNGPFPFVRGDANADEDVDIADAITSLLYLFAGAKTDCRDALDADDNGALQITDPIYSLQYLFAGGRCPPQPFPASGKDDTTDELGCKRIPQGVAP